MASNVHSFSPLWDRSCLLQGPKQTENHLHCLQSKGSKSSNQLWIFSSYHEIFPVEKSNLPKEFASLKRLIVEHLNTFPS